MRETQIYGLTKEAMNFLEENINLIPMNICPDCGCVVTTKWDFEFWEDERGLGMFDDGPMLRKFKLKDGRIVKEIIRSAAWSSGPCICMDLVDDIGNVLFGWKQSDIDDF